MFENIFKFIHGAVHIIKLDNYCQRNNARCIKRVQLYKVLIKTHETCKVCKF